MLAHQLYEESLCSGCGQPRARSMNPDMDTWYEVHNLTCYACAELDRNREDAAARQPGVRSIVVDHRPADDRPREWIPDLD